MIRPPGILLLGTCLFPVAYAQFQLSVVAGESVQPVAAVYDFGRVASGDSTSGRFQLSNPSNATAMLTLLEVAGTGFTLSGAPSLPMAIAPQASVDFTVSFTASLPGSYSAVFRADGIAAQLAAEVVPGLTFQVETAAGKIVLGSSVEFGPVPIGQASTVAFEISNLTGLALPVPTITVSGGDFAFSGAVPAGAVQPGQATGFALQFLPTAQGVRSGILTIGARTYTLTGTGIVLALPRPVLTVDLSTPASGQQGTVRVMLDGAAEVGGSGTVTLAFQPAIVGAADPAVVFASGATTATFTFGVGETQGSFGGQPGAAFQTGTTAGTLVFTVQLGGASAQQSVTIAPAPVGVTAAQAARAAASVSLELTGFDNTRTAGPLSFTFFDLAGNRLGSPIAADGGPAFQVYFAGSETGGSFVLRAVFPITGDTAQIASFQASVTNQVGITTTAQTPF